MVIMDQVDLDSSLLGNLLLHSCGIISKKGICGENRRVGGACACGWCIGVAIIIVVTYGNSDNDVVIGNILGTAGVTITGNTVTATGVSIIGNTVTAAGESIIVDNITTAGVSIIIDPIR